VAVGGLIVLSNLGTLLGSAGVDGAAVLLAHGAVAAVSLALVTLAAQRWRAARRAAAAAAAERVPAGTAS
jgi:hypothetical protein